MGRSLTVVMVAAAVPFALAAATSSSCAQAASRPLDSAERSVVIDKVAAELEKGYVFPDTARAMVQALRDRQTGVEYDRIASAAELAVGVGTVT